MRRDLLEMAVAAPLAAAAAPLTDEKGIPYRALGKTGERVSAIGIGGAHIGKSHDEKKAIAVVRSAVDAGLTFLDNCWDYNDGDSERRMGKALQDGYRDRVFLMTKIDGRTRAAALKQIEDSLTRLRTDHVDLLQLHEVIRMDDPERAFADGGAIEALAAARKQGKARFLGFTGHKHPDIHLHMLETAAKHGFRFDTVQMPLNVMDAHDDGFERKVLPILVKEEIGVLGMKPMGDGYILKSETVTPVECLHYAMSLPTSVVITGCESTRDVEQAVNAAKSFAQMPRDRVATILAKTRDLPRRRDDFERYKSSEVFDSTSKHPEWLG
jgi:predicted aldo/keto reductase-like oxidoreductase